MSEAANLKVIQGGYAAFARRDVPAILDTVADNVVWQGSYGCASHVPAAGEWTGKKGVADFFKTVEESSTVTAFEPKNFIATGDKVVVLGHYAALAHKKTAYDTDFAAVYTMRDGKVVRFQEFIDSAKLNDAFKR